MSEMSTGGLNRLVARFRQARILVVGDLMLDEFVWGKVSRISPEAPVPVVWVERESVMPGGAANVASNLRALGAQVTVGGVIGQDRLGDVLMEELARRGIESHAVVRSERPTTVKTRVIAHHQQVVRVDREEKAPLATKLTERLLSAVQAHLAEADAVIIEDYGKGVITRPLLEALIPTAKAARKLITVDPKEEHFELYHGVTALTPNRAEAGGMVDRELERDEDIDWAGRELLKRLGCEAALITLGEDGMALFERGGKALRIPTVAREVFDVAGAGDTVVATFTLALASGASMEQAARLANHAAGIVVGKLGVAVATAQELLAQLGRAPKVRTVPSRRRAARARAGSPLRGGSRA
jgi:D-beta-D-heptose 7-phosphate kinase/D-beta-D-heptose 1-phosphate adenosyltransferase